MEAVAACDEIARDLERLAVVIEDDARLGAIEIGDAHICDAEVKRGSRGGPCGDEVFDDLVLAVDSNASSAGQRRHVDVMPGAIERDVHAVVTQPLSMQSLTEADVVHQIHCALFEHTGSDAFDDVVLAAGLHDDGVDAVPVQQVAEHESRRPGADDPDLCAEACQLG